MSKNIKWLLAFLALIIFATCGYASESVLSDDATLAALLAQAESGNPQISAAGERINRAEAVLGEAKAKMGPKLGAAAAALWQQDDIAAQLPQVGSVPLVSKNVYGTAVGFIQTIYAGGSLRAMKEASSLAVEATKAESLRVRQSVANNVRVCYFNIKRAEEKELVAAEALSLTKNHLARSEKLFKSGVVAKSDVLRTKVAVAEAQMNLIRAANAVEIMHSALERAVGGAVEASILKTTKIDHTQAALSALKKISADTAPELAYEQRAELKMYSLLSKQAEKVARAEKGQLLLQVEGFGGLANTDDKFPPTDNGEWFVGAAAYWTIYDSGVVSARVKQAKSQAKELLFKLDDMKNIIKMEVTQAELNLRSSVSRLTVAERRVAESEEDYRIAVKKYESHVGTNLDMLDARLTLTASRTELIDAVYDIKTARAAITFAMGND